MGRGLSRQQRDILLLAQEGVTSTSGLIEGLFGWQPYRYGRGERRRFSYTDLRERDRQREDQSGVLRFQDFHLTDANRRLATSRGVQVRNKLRAEEQRKNPERIIPYREYNLRWASLSRSMRRLEQRGLLKRSAWYRGYFQLTEEGRKLAESMVPERERGGPSLPMGVSLADS